MGRPNRFSFAFSFVLSLLALPLIVGCGFNATTAAPIVTPGAHLSGKIYGGQNPVSSSLVILYSVGTTDYGSGPTLLLAQTTSAADGTFDIPAGSYTCPTPTTQVYITAEGGFAISGYNNPNIVLAAGLGNCSTLDNQSVNINEVTTAVTAFALNNFFAGIGLGSPDSFGAPPGDMAALTLSNTSTIPTLVNLAMGTVNPNTSTVKIEAAKIYTIANVLAACVNSTADSTSCNTLYTDTTDPYSSIAPSDTLQAAIEMAYYPYQNVSDLYNLSVPQAPFVGLSTAPNDWTIGVSYTTPTMGLGIAGSATSGTSSTIDIDTSGRIWVPSNLPTKTGVGYFDPATNKFTGPINATGVTLVQPQYLAIDPFGYVWVTDSASANLIVVDTTNTVAPSGGPITGAKALGPISIDTSGDAYFSYTATNGSADLGFIDSNTSAFSSVGTYIYNPTGLTWVLFSDGQALFASTSGSSTPCAAEELDNTSVPYTHLTDADVSEDCVSGGLAIAGGNEDGLTMLTSLNALCSGAIGECGTLAAPSVPFNLPEGVATDGAGEEWVADSGNGAVNTFDSFENGYAETSTVPYLHNSANGNTMTKPYGIAIDGSGNVWISNASCVTTTATVCTPTALVLSELIGAAYPTITPLVNQDGGNLSGSEPGENAVTDKSGIPIKSSGRFTARHASTPSASRGAWSHHPGASAGTTAKPAITGFRVPWLPSR